MGMSAPTFDLMISSLLALPCINEVEERLALRETSNELPQSSLLLGKPDIGIFL